MNYNERLELSNDIFILNRYLLLGNEISISNFVLRIDDNLEYVVINYDKDTKELGLFEFHPTISNLLTLINKLKSSKLWDNIRYSVYNNDPKSFMGKYYE